MKILKKILFTVYVFAVLFINWAEGGGIVMCRNCPVKSDAVQVFWADEHSSPMFVCPVRDWTEYVKNIENEGQGKVAEGEVGVKVFIKHSYLMASASELGMSNTLLLLCFVTTIIILRLFERKFRKGIEEKSGKN
jgi:hypothetical protein